MRACVFSFACALLAGPPGGRRRGRRPAALGRAGREGPAGQGGDGGRPLRGSGRPLLRDHARPAERAGHALEPGHGPVHGRTPPRGRPPPRGRLEAAAGSAAGVALPRIGPHGAGPAGPGGGTAAEGRRRPAGEPPGSPDAGGDALVDRALPAGGPAVPRAVDADPGRPAHMVRAGAKLRGRGADRLRAPPALCTGFRLHPAAGRGDDGRRGQARQRVPAVPGSAREAARPGGSPRGRGPGSTSRRATRTGRRSKGRGRGRSRHPTAGPRAWSVHSARDVTSGSSRPPSRSERRKEPTGGPAAPTSWPARPSPGSASCLRHRRRRCGRSRSSARRGSPSAKRSRH